LDKDIDEKLNKKINVVTLILLIIGLNDQHPQTTNIIQKNSLKHIYYDINEDRHNDLNFNVRIFHLCPGCAEIVPKRVSLSAEYRRISPPFPPIHTSPFVEHIH
jgi:hypothetical protein